MLIFVFSKHVSSNTFKSNASHLNFPHTPKPCLQRCANNDGNASNNGNDDNNEPTDDKDNNDKEDNQPQQQQGMASTNNGTASSMSTSLFTSTASSTSDRSGRKVQLVHQHIQVDLRETF